MSDKEIFKKNISELTQKGGFSIKKMDIDKNNFGNFCIELTSKKEVNIRFIRDRGTFWCEVGEKNEWYFIEDVYRLIGMDFNTDKKDVDEFLRYVSKIFIKNKKKIDILFNDKNIETTKIKIKEIEKQRGLEMFKRD